jgi:hypothetical protein
MGDEQVQEEQFTPEIMCGLWVAKHGAGKESRMGFAAAAAERFGYVAPGELQRAWDRATETLSQGE